MLNITAIKGQKQAIDYYSQHIAPGDYYGRDSAESKGIWHGKGSPMLGLSGEVNPDDFIQLCRNINPQTGEKLTPRTDIDRRVLIDFTFSPPKEVTLVGEFGGEDGKGDKRVVPLLREAVRETMATVEADVQTRVRKKGANTDRLTGNLIWSENLHMTSRPVDGKPDPFYHIHGAVLNVTFDPVEKRFKALQYGNIVRDKLYYQSVFHAHLAHKLAALGYAIEKDGNSFRIAGIDRATVEKFSRRTSVVEAEAEKRGITDAKAKGELGKKTREKKSKTPQSMTELRAEWDSRLTPEERLALQTAASRWERGDAPITPEQAKEYALEHSFQKSSVVPEKRLQAHALIYGVGSVKPEDVADIAQHPEVIARMHEGQKMTTTHAVLRDEEAMLRFAKDGQRRYHPLLSPVAADGNKAREFVKSHAGDLLAELSDEQQKAAMGILNSRDRVTGVIGKAGTGKTRMMRATVNAIKEAGHQVYVFAPSSQASRGVLKKEGFADAQTLEMLLRNEKLQQKTKGHVLWVDEAGLVSGKDMRRLFDLAKRNGNRVVLSGDYTQHGSVERTDAFRLLETQAGVRFARLTEIRRQTEPGYKKAVEAISQGSGKASQKGFDLLNKKGWVVEASGEKRHQLLVQDYLAAQDESKSALIIAPTHAEANRLTEELRWHLKERGAIGREKTFKARVATKWSEAEKGDVRNYEPGMVVDFNKAVAGKRRRIDGERVTEGGFEKGESAVVSRVTADSVSVTKRDGSIAVLPVAMKDRFQVYRVRDLTIGRGDRIRITKNGEAKVRGQAKGTEINNGDLFTVEGFNKDGDIRLEKGKILPKEWGHLALGYVDTSYASQGKTVDRVFIATGQESLPAANQQQWYVSASRGREMAKVYVDSKKDVRDAIARTGERLSAVELTRTRLASTWRQRFAQTLERNRVGRFLQRRAVAIADLFRGREGVSYA